MKVRIFFSVLLIILCLPAKAQDKALIQITGLVMTSDSLRAIPFTHVFVKSSGRGVVCNYEGFFSMVIDMGDTLMFSSVGFKEAEYIVPRDLNKNRYSMVKLMTRDTIHLSETVIYPWPSQEEFKHAFLTLNIPDDDLERAKKNLDRELMKDLARQMPQDANESQDYYQRQEADRYYYYGQQPPENIFSPLAWAQFFKAWKRGDFKQK